MSQQHNGEGTVDEKIPTTGLTNDSITFERQHNESGTSELEEKASPVHAVPISELPLPHPVSAALNNAPANVDCPPPTTLPSAKISDQVATSTSTVRSNGSRVSTAARTPQVSIDGRGNTYPEGGSRAWLVVYGSFSGMTASFGLMNTIGAYQAYVSTHQLRHLDPSTIGWIFSIYSFIAFFCGVQIGPIFDAKGPRALILAGTFCLVGGAIGVAESTSMSFAAQNNHSCLLQCRFFTLLTDLSLQPEFWHFILSFSLACGLGTSLIFTPAVSSIAHFFLRKRATATGLATTGGSIGGIVFPLMLQRLFSLVGYRWATRILAFVFLFQLIIANILIRSRLPPPPKGSLGSSIWPDWRIFKQGTFVLTTAGVFFVEWALFIPLSYITSYALAQGLSPAFSYQLLAILNAGSFFGRWAPGLLADKLGRFNTMICTVFLCMMSILCLWLTCSSSPNIVPQLVIFVIIFGFASGSNISLVPVCVGQLCDTEVFGRWLAGLYTVVSFGCLTGVPVAGSILSRDRGNYGGLIVFVGVCYAVGLACFVLARVGRVGWGWKARF